VIGEIVALIRRERPDVLITFGPEGAITQHSDHRAISRLATAAHLLAGTTTAYPEQLVKGVRPYRAARLCYVTWLQPAPESTYQTEGQPCHVQIDARPWNERKRQAFLAHASQREHRADFERNAITDLECYFIASGTPMPEGSTDLFADLA
jgi:LmbE family N-acetylglucosaminyl deacetylase